MTARTSGRGVLVLGTVLALSAGAAALTVATKGPDERRITINCSVGDGMVWAGGFTCTYAVGSEAKAYKVLALDPKDIRANTFTRPLTVKVGTAVSVACRAEWPDKPVAAWIVGGGHTAKKNLAVSPAVASQVRTIS